MKNKPLPLMGPGSPPSETAGISLRDYFAAKAMAAMIVPPDDPGYIHERTVDIDYSWIPRLSYGIAEAMLKERAKRMAASSE